ncbi:hypothetical protein CYLTODRAFT_364382 [Cylindrobasidium torrendii FP15055 ss-10]|uniref:CHAT domain-containing protein n=1 Tax=Cylindrobasidium torrendii FP15055 ss-10 TaxID=1314674 RepID=A0A0D7BWQ0_9AGAR|nr:hypothetical protein CYLTODRAFT_364382 [Cylindrobasidium torrendii FP15055 ss-10]
MQRAAKSAPSNPNIKSLMLANVANCYVERFGMSKNSADLDEAIALCRLAMPMTTHSGLVPRPRFRGNLADLLTMRLFNGRGARSDFDEIAMLRAEDEVPSLPSELTLLWGPNCLMSLSDDFFSRYKRARRTYDIGQAIALRERAVGLLPEGGPRQEACIVRIAAFYFERFTQHPNIEDIQRNVTLLKAVCKKAENSDNAELWDTLGWNCYIAYATLSGTHGIHQYAHILEEGVAALRRVVTPANGARLDLRQRAKYSSHLGGLLYYRYIITMDRGDLEEVIVWLSIASSMMEDDGAQKDSWLLNLGLALCDRYEYDGSPKDKLGDIDEALSYLRHLASKNSHEPEFLIGLTRCCLSRYRPFAEDPGPVECAVLEEALDIQQKLDDLLPPGDAGRGTMLYRLSSIYRYRFQRSKDLADVEKAISASHEGLDYEESVHTLLAVADSHLARLESSLAPSLGHSDFNSASEAYKRATHAPGGTTWQYGAAQKDKDLHVRFAHFCPSPQSLLDTHKRILELLTNVAWMGHPTRRRYVDIDLGKPGHAATAASLDANCVAQALEWFEEGRAIVWNQTMNLRTPLSDLSMVHPEYAEQYKTIASELDARPDLDHDEMKQDKTTSDIEKFQQTEEEGRNRRSNVYAYETLVGKIQGLPGFERFPRPRRAQDVHANIDGPVICINLDDTRCDALIILHSPAHAIIHVPLPKLSIELAGTLRDQWGKYLASRGVRTRNYRAGAPLAWDGADDPAHVLAELWDFVVQPILPYIIELDANDGRLSHVTWCTSGSLAFLPLHAAGRYGVGRRRNVFELFNSSYTPTLANISPRTLDTGGTPEARSVLVVAQAMPGRSEVSPLHGTVEEADRIAQVFPTKSFKLLRDDEGTADAVLKSMGKYPWIHLACHGIQNTNLPAQSALILYDRNLTLNELMKTTSSVGELAFLSACETATGAEDVPDEAVHLAAGMLAVGYRSVVATMWAIGDGVAPSVAETFYRTLIEEKMAGRGMQVAHALHVAVEKVKEEVGEDNFAEWVPFVHYGV